jgi:hypothetical protein
VRFAVPEYVLRGADTLVTVNVTVALTKGSEYRCLETCEQYLGAAPPTGVR